MAIDLNLLLEELQAKPILPDHRTELTRAILADVFRDLSMDPFTLHQFNAVIKTAPRGPFLLDFLAWIHTHTSLTRMLQNQPYDKSINAHDCIRCLLLGCHDLEDSVLIKSIFRQEEFIRKWLSCWKLAITNETPQQSTDRLQQLDSSRLKKVFSENAQQQQKKRKKWLEKMREKQAQERDNYE